MCMELFNVIEAEAQHWNSFLITYYRGCFSLCGPKIQMILFELSCYEALSYEAGQRWTNVENVSWDTLIFITTTLCESC